MFVLGPESVSADAQRALIEIHKSGQVRTRWLLDEREGAWVRGGWCCELAGDGILVAVPGDGFLADWCDRYLGARPARVLFRSGHLSQVVGAELADGRQVVIKARAAGPRIAGCVAVQGHLARMGFPCPEPLAAPVQAGGLTVTAEVLVPGGGQLPAEGGAAPFAALLARLVSSAPGPAAVPSLTPSPPWTGWDHPGHGCA